MLKITPITNLNSEYKTLSNHAQNIVKSQIKSVSHWFDKFFCEENLNLIAAQKINLKNNGIKYIGKTKAEGIIISGDKFDYHVFSPNSDIFEFSTIDKKNHQVYQSFSLSSKSNMYRCSGNVSKNSAEDFLSGIIDFVDLKLSSAKNMITPKAPQPYIPDESTAQKIDELNRTLHTTKKRVAIKNHGFIDDEDERIIQLIVEKYDYIKELYKKVPNDTSRMNVRSYYKNYITQPGMNKMAFRNIGPMGEPISLFYTTHRNNPYLVIGVTDVYGKESKYVISQKGTVQRNLPYKRYVYGNCHKRSNTVPDYYTQEEIDKSNLYAYLACLNNEMQLFAEHTENWLKTQENNKIIHSNKDIATLDKYDTILEDISVNFNKYKTNVMRYLSKFDARKRFKVANNVSTEIATTAVKFENITPEGFDLRLSYPRIPNNVATQILVMKGDSIEKSFYILDKKLLRFNINKLTDKFTHIDRNLYFFDNEYLNQSHLDKYLELLRDKLQDLNGKLDEIRAKQRKRRNITTQN